MAVHVVCRSSDGWMWQSWDGESADPPPGFSCPEGFEVRSFEAATGAWWPARRAFAPAATPTSVKAALLALLGPARVRELLETFPAALAAVDARDWAAVRSAADAALALGMITAEERAVVDAAVPS